MRWLTLAVLLPMPGYAAPPTFQPPPVQYAVKPPPLGGSAPHGWGLYAVAKGRSLELSSRALGWSDAGSPNTDLAAGYGWWGRSSSAVFGYVQHDPRPALPSFVARDPSGRRLRGSGVLGIGFTLRAP